MCDELNGWAEHQDACIVHNMEEQQCLEKGEACAAVRAIFPTASLLIASLTPVNLPAGGTLVERADTEAACTKFKGCFDKDMDFIPLCA